MNDLYLDIIRDASGPLDPIPTGLSPSLPQLSGIRAVLLDIYGTLLVSASGDIGAADPNVRGDAFAEAIGAVGGRCQGNASAGAAEVHRVIEQHHTNARAAGVEYPEVEIIEVWQDVCRNLAERSEIEVPENVDLARLAIEFEVRVNPIWPMPGWEQCLAELRSRGTVVGIISNAQFFTPLAIHAVGRKSLDELGFDALLRYYSYEHRCAKPGRELYDLAVDGLDAKGIDPREVLYVGNDMRNDIWPAVSVGFHTALFAGDQRSLRLREDDPLYDSSREAEAIVTELTQIPGML